MTLRVSEVVPLIPSLTSVSFVSLSFLSSKSETLKPTTVELWFD